MKMPFSINGILCTLALLVLWRAEELAEACSCAPVHPQQAFCNADVDTGSYSGGFQLLCPPPVRTEYALLLETAGKPEGLEQSVDSPLSGSGTELRRLAFTGQRGKREAKEPRRERAERRTRDGEFIRAKVVGEREVDSGNDVYGNPIKRIQYEVKQIKMFKGPNQDIEAVFTAPVSAVCGVTLDVNGKKEYLISGKAEADGRMHVTLCDYIMPWDSLSNTQKKGLSQRYEMGCECKVKDCL
ncbi:hypothetical protein FQN60_002951, partial [Etheostoma spectabile]